MNATQSPLAREIARWTLGTNTLADAIPGLTLHRWEHPTDPTSCMMGPSLCLIAQGRKRVILGDEHFVYDACHFLITSVDLPVVANIIEASPDAPYLGLSLLLDFPAIARLMVGDAAPAAKPAKDPANPLAIAVEDLSRPMSDAFARLVGLLAEPESVAALAQLIKQEIYYRLLASAQGFRLRRMISAETQSHRIARAIDWLKDNFATPIKIEDLAVRAGMSPSAFHSHFRSVTAMSPLQYQKRMRLSEARRLMLTQKVDAATAAFEVGYESPSQFSREYSRMFGAPPLRDIKTLMQVDA